MRNFCLKRKEQLKITYNSNLDNLEIHAVHEDFPNGLFASIMYPSHIIFKNPKFTCIKKASDTYSATLSFDLVGKYFLYFKSKDAIIDVATAIVDDVYSRSNDASV
jgi:hypothetical protein